MPLTRNPAGLARWLANPDAPPLALEVALKRTWRAHPDEVLLDVRYEHRAGRVFVEVDGAGFFLDEPVRLEPVAIPKPWGQEIWYSGIEARGESRVITHGVQLPLSTYLAAAPEELAGGQPVLLLKVLDPRPEPVLGDLYFEVHEHKREVYVVTAVDRTAWPDGRGAIRFGMSQRVRAAHGNDASFRAAYLAAVREYERIRRALDTGRTVAGGVEGAARAAMEAFTELRQLEVGDVVVVPTWLPHSLQHGVRVVEFQTPTYERYIISFGQRVLTQDHWDTGHAVAHMCLDEPPKPAFEALGTGLERLASFPDFGVLRATVEPGRGMRLPAPVPYAICCAIDAPLHVGMLELGPGQACFVPGPAVANATLTADRAAQCLVAAPGT